MTKPQAYNVGLFGETIVANLNPIIQVKFPYNINSGFVSTSTAGSGTVTHADSQAILSTTAATSSSAELSTKDAIVYQTGQACYIRFTSVFTEGVAGSTQRIGIGEDSDGFFVGYNGTEFGVLHIQNSVEEWIPQADFNGPFKESTFSTIFDSTKGNIYQIEYQWLGYGFIQFSIFNPLTTAWEIMHRVCYPNRNIVPSVYNPSFPINAKVENTTNNTNIILSTPSLAAFVQGKSTNSYIYEGVDNAKTITTEVNVLTIKNNTTHQSITNRSIVFPQEISVLSDGTKPAVFRVYLNTTLGGTPSYTDIDADVSTVSYDTAGTTVTGGTQILSIFAAKESGVNLTLPEDLKLRPGDILTISAQSSASNDTVVGIAWKELH